MATIITDLKESFRRGNIYIQLIYINVGVFIFTTLTGVILQLFNRSLGGVFEWLELPASLPRFIIQPWSVLTYMFMHAGVLHILFNMLWLYWFGALFLNFFSARHLRGSIHLRRNLRRTALYDGLQHLPLFPSDDGILFHAGSIGIRTRYRGGYRLSGT